MRSKTKKSKSSRVSFIQNNGRKILTISILMIFLLMIPRYWKGEKFTYLPTYGIRLPLKHDIHGIDVSHHQGKINWEKVRDARSKKAKISFCFIKATEGISIKDQDFNDNWTGIKKVGIKAGAYHFFIPWADAKKQAIEFASIVNLNSGDLRPVLDFEIEGGKRNWPKMVENVKIWLNYVEQKYGVKPIIYTNKSMYRKYIKGNFDDYPLWIADYNSLKLDGYDDAEKLLLWQHSQSGRISGIRGSVDFNVFLGTDSDFKEICM